MTPFLMLLSLPFLCAQDPQVSVGLPQDPSAAAARTLDLVLLKNGDQLEGRITAQLDGYVEIQLEAGAKVGISMAMVQEVRRGAGAAVTTANGPVPPRNEWFVLHDAQGAAVGWLHASVVVRTGGELEATEEYEFAEGHRRYQVTSMCRADAMGAPQSCYFRERISEPVMGAAVIAASGAQSDRVVDERIVEAKCVGNELHVARLDRTGRRERCLEWNEARTFPLLARTLARHQGTSIAAGTMFDPATEELVVRSFDGARQRRVTVDGKTQDVTEIAESSVSGRNSEWLDASQRTLRRELAGPSLVALPSSAESARAAAGGAAIPSALVREAGGEFGLWAPNPAWAPVEGLPAGQVALFCEARGASIGFSRMDHLEANTPLDTAADAVANWFRLLYPELRIERREASVVREQPSVRLVAGGKSAGAPVTATVDVIPHRGQFLVLVCRAPVAAWDELAPDFAFFVRSVELEAQSMAPTLQGPLAERAQQEGAGRPKAAPVRTEPAAKPPMPSGETAPKSPRRPLVLIPKDG